MSDFDRADLHGLWRQRGKRPLRSIRAAPVQGSASEHAEGHVFRSVVKEGDVGASVQLEADGAHAVGQASHNDERVG